MARFARSVWLLLLSPTACSSQGGQSGTDAMDLSETPQVDECELEDCSPETDDESTDDDADEDSATGCNVGGLSYEVGEGFDVECNSCECLADGEIACTEQDCDADDETLPIPRPDELPAGGDGPPPQQADPAEPDDTAAEGDDPEPIDEEIPIPPPEEIPLGDGPPPMTPPAMPSVPSIPSQPDPGCLSADEAPPFGGSSELYTVTDGASTLCLDITTPEEVCFSGVAADATGEYIYWGGGLGLAMGTETDDGIAPFDAAELGITHVGFELEGVDDFVIRPYLNQVDDPRIDDPASNFMSNSFMGAEIERDGSFIVALERFALPEWTLLDVDQDGTADVDQEIDLTQLNSIQFLFATQAGRTFNYEICVRNLRWLDADGNVVLPQ